MISLAMMWALWASLVPSPHNVSLWQQALLDRSRDKHRFALGFCLGALMFDLLFVSFLGTFSGLSLFQSRYFIGTLRTVSALYVGWILWKSLGQWIKGPKFLQSSASDPGVLRGLSFVKGFLVQSVNPKVYLFWTLVAAPLLLTEARQGRALFVIVFAVTLYTLKLIYFYLLAFGRIQKDKFRFARNNAIECPVPRKDAEKSNFVVISQS